jgi:hypothetical protein
MYLKNVNNYFQDFRSLIKYATVKIEIARSEFETPPNAAKRDEGDSSLCPLRVDFDILTTNEGHPTPQWVLGRVYE